MKLTDYTSRYLFWPLDNDLHGFGDIHRSVDTWLDILAAPEEQIEALNQSRLLGALENAYQHVPYYRQMFDSLGLAGRIESPDILRNIPYLEKKTIRSRPDEFLNEEIPRGEMIRSMTGGSTSEPMEFFRDKSAHCSRWGLQYACNEEIGWKQGEWYAIV